MSIQIVENSFAATLRLLHRRRLKWEPERLRDALVSWSQGVLVPAYFTKPDKPEEKNPCAFTTLYGYESEVVVLSHEGICICPAKLIGLEVRPKNTWHELPRVAEDVKALQKSISNHHLDAILASTSKQLPAVILNKVNNKITRYHQVSWEVLRSNPDCIPDFESAEICFNWLRLVCYPGCYVQASDLFHGVLAESKIAKWLDTDDAWLQLTEKLSGIALDHLDNLENLPLNNESFANWLYATCAPRVNNHPALLTLMLENKGTASKYPDKLAMLADAWLNDRSEIFKRLCAELKGWSSLPTILANNTCPGPSVREELWKYYSDSYKRELEIKNLSAAIGKKQDVPDAAWLEISKTIIGSEHCKYSDFPLRWSEAALTAYTSGTHAYGIRRVLRFIEGQLETMSEEDGLRLFTKILKRAITDSDLDLETTNHLKFLAKTHWLNKSSLWATIEALDLPPERWLDLIEPAELTTEMQDIKSFGFDNVEFE